MKSFYTLLILLSAHQLMLGQNISDSITSDSIFHSRWLDGQGSPGIYHVSMIELIANPDKFDNKTVMVSGFMHLEFESNVLYLHPEDYRMSMLKNGIWLRLNDYLETNIKLDDFNDQYVCLSGIFNAKQGGHGGRYSGSIEEVFSIYVLEERK